MIITHRVSFVIAALFMALTVVNAAMSAYATFYAAPGVFIRLSGLFILAGTIAAFVNTARFELTSGWAVATLGIALACGMSTIVWLASPLAELPSAAHELMFAALCCAALSIVLLKPTIQPAPVLAT